MDNFDLKKFVSGKTLLNENSPGFDTRKQGEALPTLASVKAAYEANITEANADAGLLKKLGIDGDVMEMVKKMRAAIESGKVDDGDLGTIEGIGDAVKKMMIDGAESFLKESKKTKLTSITEGIITEGKKSELDKKLAEIDKEGAKNTLEAKIAAIDEAMEKKESRINMVQEDENLSELIDKKRVKEMQKEIKLLERSKKVYEKQLDKVNGIKTERVKKEIVDEYNTEPHDAPDNSMDTEMSEKKYYEDGKYNY